MDGSAERFSARAVRVRLRCRVTLARDRAAGQQADLAGRIDSVVQRLAHPGWAGARTAEVTPSELATLAILRAAGPLRVGNSPPAPE